MDGKPEVFVRRYRCGVSVATLLVALAAATHAAAQTPTSPEPEQPAAAQTDPAGDEPPADGTEVEAVVVTGFRASLQSALSAKRNETGVVDVINAEDIADFPDTNLAESIQRIPGVSIDRDAGEGRQLTVRGLSSDFTRTRINGMEAQATTGGTDSSGGANRGRGFDFNVFASELFNNITVRKTSSAETEEGSLGATIDLRTTRPFDYKGFTSAASLQYGYNDLSETWDPRAAFLISDTFADGKFGVLASLAYSERNLFEDGYSSVRWDNGPSSEGFCSPVGFTPQNRPNNAGNGITAANCATGLPRAPNTAANNAAYNTARDAANFHPRLPRYGRLTHAQERLGFTGALQFRPTDRTSLSYDLLYSKLDSTRQEDFLEALSFSRNTAAGGKSQVLVREVVAEGGELVYGLFDNVDLRTESRFDELTTEFTQHTLTLEHDFSERLRVRGYVGQAVSDFKNPVQTTITFERTNSDGYSWDYRNDPNRPELSYGFDVASPANWQWKDIGAGTSVAVLPRSEIRLRPNGVETLFQAAQFDVEFDLDERITFKAGINLKTFESDSEQFRRTEETVVPALPSGTTVANISNVLTGFGRNFDLAGATPTTWLRPDVNAVASLFNIYCNCNTGVPGGDFTLTSITNGDARGGNRFIDENDLAYYLQADFTFDVMGMRLRGNAGVRQVETELYAEGYSSTGGGTLVSGTYEYSDTLPSVNLALDVTNEIIVRFAAAKVMARPQIGNSFSGANYLVPTTSLAAGGPNFTASIGNVELDPFRATTYDLSFEWYFAPQSLLSLALFYKDIDSYIQVVRQDLPYSDLTALNPEAFAPGFCTGVCSPSTLFALTSALNTEGGPLQGFEISYQQPFTFLHESFGLPAWVGNFGVILNYTKVKSEIDYCNNALCTAFVTNDLVNLSPTAYNTTLYYEDSRLSARISTSYRDEYLQNVPGRNNNRVEGKAETFNVDASASYNLTEQVTLTFEGLNLTDEPNHQWVGDETRQSTSVYHHTGRQYYFGARYKF